MGWGLRVWRGQGKAPKTLDTEQWTSDFYGVDRRARSGHLLSLQWFSFSILSWMLSSTQQGRKTFSVVIYMSTTQALPITFATVAFYYTPVHLSYVLMHFKVNCISVNISALS